MRIVKLLGGLGNQMFQFALYEALRLRYPEERVLLDLHCFRGYGKHRGFELKRVFGISYEEASWRDIARLAYPYPNYQAWRIGSRLLPHRKTMLCEQDNLAIEPDALNHTESTYYDGYWQHEDYFKDIRRELLHIYRFPELKDERNIQTAVEATTCNSCAVHIRRGDYLTDPLRKGTTDNGYIERAIRLMQDKERPKLWCIFSDDSQWAREHLGRLFTEGRTIFVDWNQEERSIHDMHLMSLCHHQIIANSSFSWWGAWLCQRESHTVIAPHLWMNRKNVCSPVPEKWVRL